MLLSNYTGLAEFGEPTAKVWVCGIEPGGEAIDLKKWPSSKGPRYRNNSPEQDGNCQNTKWRYDQRVAKLLSAIKLLERADTPPPNDLLENWQHYNSHQIYRKGGSSFKLNLFSLPKPSDASWPYSGITKAEYHVLCMQYRFAFLKELKEKYRPKVIIGTGLMHQQSFFEAFGFKAGAKPSLVGCLKTFSAYDGETTLLVCPFFGRPMSNLKMIELAKKVHAIIHQTATRQT